MCPTVDNINAVLRGLGSVQKLKHDESDVNLGLDLGTMARDKEDNAVRNKKAKSEQLRLSYERKLLLSEPKHEDEEPRPPTVIPFPPLE